MAVYDAHRGPKSIFLWRVMGRDGLQPDEIPLVTQFEKGFESVQKHKYACTRVAAPIEPNPTLRAH